MHAPQAQLIALDWGTSSLRAYLLSAQATVLEQRHRPWGLMQLPNGGTAAAFAQAFDEICGTWLDAAPTLPVIAAGMIGSAQGWRETPYLALPVDLTRVGEQLTRIETQRGNVIHVVPGLIEHSSLPNVIRGEETQVIGALHMHPPSSQTNVLVGLPGTHSKWVRVNGTRIEHFDTFMTGEVYAALRDHTILSRTIQSSIPADDEAFERGLRVTLSSEASIGVLSTIFSCRTLGLTGALRPGAQADYLSGLLIGHELAGLHASSGLPARTGPDTPHIVLVGDAALCQRYTRALSFYGHSRVEIIEHATEHGLWQLARQAGLIGPA
ncbi:2-dehydro-3-deoxygalactonokinase [Paraburkholderia bonniea]|uniref:2-dehydro-3-deoxygalactonokinase n=1 Tax=Paraburkholderia bonniea TaxID=2152891 RepID=UPI0012922228|nr:2-dehydro-3-deoxygalactonokinase [Paraburkholderia bonniea]WJF89427.1 2-dehydro-3-deoxygalactonokinase [Paraburkholderia bonniea]WJF92742.1 2-dehydro-3-deoxygalactonokinase [Paraburkholderia bonniea]